jgi:hypothetical protein
MGPCCNQVSKSNRSWIRKKSRGPEDSSPGAKCDTQGRNMPPQVEAGSRCKMCPQGWSWPQVQNVAPRDEVGPKGEVVTRGEVGPKGYVTLTPRSEVIPWGWRPSIRPFSLLNIRECSSLGWTKGSTCPLGNKVHPCGLSSPVVAKFAPRLNSCC